MISKKHYDLKCFFGFCKHFVGFRKYFEIVPYRLPYISHFLLALFQNKFKDEPVVLITAEHLRTGKESDATLIWTEDVTKDSFKVCLRELQNFDGKHEDISVVCSLSPRIAKL